MHGGAFWQGYRLFQRQRRIDALLFAGKALLGRTWDRWRPDRSGLGLAYALKYQGKTGCCLCFLGDGAVNQGVYHESLNLASLWSLPIVYIIENNGYSMGTSLSRSSAFKDSLAERAEGYNIPWGVVNGEQLYEIRAKTQVAIERAHLENRPTVLEVFTYRYYGHSVADANTKKYRIRKRLSGTRVFTIP